MTRIGILSDIHGNLHALEAVLAHPDAKDVDHWWCLGDTVGYGAFPNECVDRVRDLCDVVLAGNHDAAALGTIRTTDFNPVAETAALWTRRQLRSDATQWLRELPHLTEAEGILLAHASPADPVWHYVLDAYDVRRALHGVSHALVLVGHTHAPRIWSWDAEHQTEPMQHGYGAPLALTELGPQVIANPGSVGQPRLGDPRASWATLDLDGMLWTHRRCDYDIAGAQDAIRAAGLPESLAVRLAEGC